MFQGPGGSLWNQVGLEAIPGTENFLDTAN